MTYANIAERLAANVVVQHVSSYVSTPCKCWQGRLNNSGYPTLTMRVPGKAHPVPVYAHRKALELKLGRPILPGHEADHQCYNTACIADDHLLEQPKAVNQARRRNVKAH